MDSNEKVVIITGGGNGLGRAASLRFAREGMSVVVADFQDEAARQTVAEITDQGGQAVAFGVDVTDRASVHTMVEEVVNTYGRIDVLINNAGITADATLAKLTESQWDQVINVNLKGVFTCTQAVLPTMVQAGKGRIINTSSVVALYGNFGQTNYAASKAGVIGMTKTWAKELGRKGICVNAVAPGFIVTDMTKAMPADVFDEILKKVPLQRGGVPEDIANVYYFLASDEASYINGAVIPVDGGVTL